MNNFSTYFVVIALSIFWFGNAIGSEFRIKDENDFSTFVNNVNKGFNYSGTTVYLGSDLSLSSITKPIGINRTYFFSGTFDGQGHVISDLNINSSSYHHSGLFGYSRGLTIRNIILDSSCSFINSFTGNDIIFMGGIIGYCYGFNGSCEVENSVNMASSTFIGNTTNNLYLGGIAGEFVSLDHHVHVKNCINYGNVTHSGVSSFSYIGGIFGGLEGQTLYYNYVYNCINYGTLIHNETTSLSSLHIGGIAGDSNHGYTKNCVNSGKIVLSSNYLLNCAGNILGNNNLDSQINYCYYTSDANISRLCGCSNYSPNTENTPDSPNIVDSTLINNLNSQVNLNNEWNKWILNSNNNTVTFKVNNNKGFSFSSQLILLPDPNTTSSLVFSGWYNDPYYKNEFKSDETTENSTLYGLYGKIITVHFNATEGNVDVTSKKVSMNNPYGDLPEPLAREGYTFFGWFTEKNEAVKNDTIVNFSYDHTLYAHWTINNYTITFIFDNGISSEVRTFEFNAKVIYPDDPVREGYTFNGWNEIDINAMPAENLTITAQWKEISSTQVEIVFNTKNLSENEIREFIKRHTDSDFIIIRIEDDKTGNVKTIIKFIDTKEAENFVETIRASSEMNITIKKVGFIVGSVISFSLMIYPFLFFIISILF